jgi:hypothetical protein
VDAAPNEPPEQASPRTFANPRHVPIHWKGQELPVLYANLLWGIVDDLGDIVISIGQVEPPSVAAGDVEARQRAVDAIDHTDGQILFRFSASPERLKMMVEQIDAVIHIRGTWQREVLGREQEGA